MGIPDSYDPLMFLNQAQNANEAASNASPQTPGDSASYPAALGQFDGTANMGTTGGDPMPLSTFMTPGDNSPRWPAGVNNFDPLNLPAPERIVVRGPSKGVGGQP